MGTTADQVLRQVVAGMDRDTIDRWRLKVIKEQTRLGDETGRRQEVLDILNDELRDRIDKQGG